MYLRQNRKRAVYPVPSWREPNLAGVQEKYSKLLKVYKGLKQVDSNVLQFGLLEGMFMNEIVPLPARSAIGM